MKPMIPTDKKIKSTLLWRAGRCSTADTLSQSPGVVKSNMFLKRLFFGSKECTEELKLECVSPTHRRAIKEENKNFNRDLVDHQASSLLQYINVIANLFIMRNYSNELRWKIITANLYTKSPQNSGSESPWRKRDLSPTWNLEIKS